MAYLAIHCLGPAGRIGDQTANPFTGVIEGGEDAAGGRLRGLAAQIAGGEAANSVL